MSPSKSFFETASFVQLSVHSLVQTSCELLVLMLSHSLAQESVCVFVHAVVSVVVQPPLHMLYVFSEQLCSTDVVAQVVMQSWTGLNSQLESAVRNTPPHLSSALACAVLGKSETPNSRADADNAVVIRRLMVRLPRILKCGRDAVRGLRRVTAASVPADRVIDVTQRRASSRSISVI
jgi:hypothetical protein